MLRREDDKFRSFARTTLFSLKKKTTKMFDVEKRRSLMLYAGQSITIIVLICCYFGPTTTARDSLHTIPGEAAVEHENHGGSGVRVETAAAATSMAETWYLPSRDRADTEGLAERPCQPSCRRAGSPGLAVRAPRQHGQQLHRQRQRPF
jgi:hypothetical protein